MRFDDFKRELSGMLLLNPKDFEAGIQIFVIGMFKKMVLADHLNIFVNDVFSAPKAFHSLTVLWAVITYSLQIYFDFSGYSDMAIGSARMLGFHLPKNFNFPYLSSNLTEFWKRWHILLASGICLLFSWRQPKGPGAHLSEPITYHGDRRTLAWSRMDLSGLGSPSRYRPDPA